MIKEMKIVARDVCETIAYFAQKRRSHLNESSIGNIHFICYGNICRSPFSEYYARKLFFERGLDIEVTSSGVAGSQGEKSPEYAIIAADLFGIDLKQHRSRAITKDMIDVSMLIAGMHYFHYKELNRLFPKDKDRFYLLKHLVWPRYLSLNINDPFGKPLKDYIACFSQIRDCIDNLAEKIQYSRKGENKPCEK
jgi:protein-tyrosine phosphatase